MKYIIYIWLTLITLIIFPVTGNSSVIPVTPDKSTLSVDSIIDKVMFYSPLYESLVTDFRADLYIKGKVYIRKRNFLLRYLPSMFRMKKGVKEYIMESYNELHYTAPNIYDQKVKATSGTTEGFRGPGGQLMDYFHANVYSSSLLHSKLVSPLMANAKQYYTYNVDSIIGPPGDRSYLISFTPRNKSYQLVRGYMIVSDDVWSIRKMQFSGRSEYMRFDNLIQMGEVGEEDEFLPRRYDLNVTFKMLGNIMDGNYTATYDYSSVVYTERRQRTKRKKHKDYDLTESYTLLCDTSTYRTDFAYFDSIRPLPLSEREADIYKDYKLAEDTVGKANTPKTSTKIFWGRVGDILWSNYSVNLPELGHVRFSPLLNPLLMSYSKRDGFSYRQEFRFNRVFEGDRLLRIRPRMGYNFKRKEFYWSANGDFDYWPRKRAALHFNIGNGNRIYSSDVLDDLKQMPDSIFDFDKLNLDYFRDFYINIRHSLEVMNGLSIDLGISMHKRTAINKPEIIPVNPSSMLAMDPNIAGKVRDTYTSFAPRVRISWTPGQYYYMNGDRKVNLYSDFPTFTVDWERGIKGVFKSTGKYERIEFDMQHGIKLGMMRSIYYRAGFGAFTNQEQLYFVDFANFTRSNLPSGWNDDIGGVFHVLDGRWYNSSRKYLRGHVTYEAPFLLMPRLMKYTRNILNERLYFGLLMVPRLNPYIELGYGIGTHIFDVGIFVSNVNGKFSEFGFKFTFELFNR